MLSGLLSICIKILALFGGFQIMLSGLLSICNKILNWRFQMKWLSAILWWLSAILWWLSSYTCTFTIQATQDMIVQKEYCLSHTQCITEYYYNIVRIYYNKHFVNDIMSINCSWQFHVHPHTMGQLLLWIPLKAKPLKFLAGLR